MRGHHESELGSTADGALPRISFESAAGQIISLHVRPLQVLIHILSACSTYVI